jgi:hypothetical protein
MVKRIIGWLKNVDNQILIFNLAMMCIPLFLLREETPALPMILTFVEVMLGFYGSFYVWKQSKKF